MIAAQFGALNDMLKASGSPLGIESPISPFPDFEHLEFKGQKNQKHLGPFLQAMGCASPPSFGVFQIASNSWNNAYLWYASRSPS